MSLEQSSAADLLFRAIVESDTFRALVAEQVQQELNARGIATKRKAAVAADGDRMVTREEAAKIAKVSKQTISRWLSGGQLTNHGLGQKVLISERELLEPSLKKFNRLKQPERIRA